MTTSPFIFLLGGFLFLLPGLVALSLLLEEPSQGILLPSQVFAHEKYFINKCSIGCININILIG
jgi:hypothetical protein